MRSDLSGRTKAPDPPSVARGPLIAKLWRKLWRTGHGGLPQTTARRLAVHLAGLGISQTEITHQHLRSCYDRLNKLDGAADFAAVAPLLDALEPAASAISDPVLGVIVETRRHPNLGPIVRAFISRKIPIQVFHGEANREFLLGSLSADESRAITCRRLPVSDLPIPLYNALLLSERFWLSLVGRGKILIFQTDTICCSGSDYQLSDFMEFDYIGSLWPRQRPVGIIADGGNGGLSLRDWRASLECLRRFPSILWPGGEDGYFAFHMDLAGMRVGDGESCARFSTQFRFLRRSWGVHKPSCLSKKEQAALVAYCPEAAMLLK